MDDFHSRYTELRMIVYRHTSSVVFNGNGIVLVYGDIYSAAESGKSFVDTVVHYFVYEMMESSRPRTSYIHTGPFSYSFKAFKNLYLLSAILLDIFVFRHSLISFFTIKILIPLYHDSLSLTILKAF